MTGRATQEEDPIAGADLLPFRTRALTTAEKRLLASRARALHRRAGGSRLALVTGAGAIVFLWLATLLASDAPGWVITTFWLGAGSLILLWVRRDLTRDARDRREMGDALESAARANHAEVLDVRARRYAELEEVEDEGACYAFEIADRTVVIICGQEFYREARFPSLDFSLVRALEERGATAHAWIAKRGGYAMPVRVIPAASKRALDVPEHLSVIRCELDDLEDALTRVG